MKKNTVVTALLLAVFATAVPIGTWFSGMADSAESKFNSSREITVISRESGSGTRGAFIELFGLEEKTKSGKKDRTTQEAIIADKTDIVMTSVAGDPHAIGYISLGSLNSRVKAVAVDGIKPSAKAIVEGKYTIQRPFYIATKSQASSLAADFIKFILSKEGQSIIVKNGYVAANRDAKPHKGEPAKGKLVIAGSSSVTPVMEKLKEAYSKINAGASIEIQMSDSTAGMAAVNNGTCDIGMASREMKAAEKEKLRGLPIAYDGIALIVNKVNPTNSLTVKQVKSIYIGESVRWSDVQ